MHHPQDQVQHHSLSDPETFWGHQAEHVYWHKKPSAVLARTTKGLESGETHDHWEWFPDGEISTCYNCVDRHVLAGHGDHPAILYDSPVTNTKQRITYKQLLDEVEVFAAVLREEGVKKGDVVLVYMPMVPAALIGILAINRLGAIHAVVFGGFAAAALAQRIEASRPAAILTASCGIDGNKPPIPYRDFIEEAVRISPWKPPKTIIWQREQLFWQPTRKLEGERKWQNLVKSARARNMRAKCVPVKSTDPIYIIYTSGTTGLPKGVLREAGGHAVGLHLSISYLFGIHGPGDVMGCFSDIGWVVSHSYTLYGPLLTGAATVLYEGKPIGTPDASAFWRLVEEYKINTMFTAPTALRAIRKDDPDNSHLARIGKRGGLRSLKALFLAGERSEPAIITMYQDLLKKYGNENSHVVDNWWSSESGSPISGIALVPHAGRCRQTGMKEEHPPLDIKPGSAGKAMPGFDVRVVDDEGHEVQHDKMGNIVLALPLAPTAFRTLWEDEERFYKGYLKRFGGKWLDTGDAGCVDENGYIHIMARTDDIINVAAHRLSTGTLEQAITSHPLVAEACVVGIPDALKGQLPFAFVTASAPVPDRQLFAEIQTLVRSQVGAIASLGGMIQGRGMIPKTRSGKTLRRVLRELVENAVHGEFDKEVNVPSTVEDLGVVQVAREEVRAYFRAQGKMHGAFEVKGKL
ncbi:acyl-CoA synthetase short-chain family member 3, mitochondrial [Chaetomidium leptoderma]|uniref:Acyl-CoA synthetase short-chain family member 3, mitochondrial n=1 Tax=Chaetomidium leptoderma TaxID=669021 RepID=A0AAN6ZUI9_9PEZI|nr:acyl-CoA synthetase short-chain family member 3, mitochondrial [Chaetomidium leptoderma]